MENIYTGAMKNKTNFLYKKAEEFPYEKSKGTQFYRQYNSVMTIHIENKEPFARNIRNS